MPKVIQRDTFLHLVEQPYVVDDCTYRVTRIWWQRPDGSVVTTFKDSGEDGEWHLGADIPTPTQLTAHPFGEPAVLADAPRHSAEVEDGDDD